MIQKESLKIIRILFLILSIIWYGCIFLLTENRNMNSIKTFTQVESALKPMQKIDKNFFSQYLLIDNINFVVRVCAHIFIFFIQAILIIHYLYLSNINFNTIVAFTLVVVSLLGLLDEIHQMYVPNRQFRLIDVLKDDIGALLAIIVFYSTKKLNFIIKKYED